MYFVYFLLCKNKVTSLSQCCLNEQITYNETAIYKTEKVIVYCLCVDMVVASILLNTINKYPSKLSINNSFQWGWVRCWIYPTELPNAFSDCQSWHLFSNRDSHAGAGYDTDMIQDLWETWAILKWHLEARQDIWFDLKWHYFPVFGTEIPLKSGYSAISCCVIIQVWSKSHLNWALPFFSPD